MNLKSKIASIVRHCPPLFRLGSRLYHSLNTGFKSLSPGAPGAIEWALKTSVKLHSGKIIGDYYEFGLYKGYTFFIAYRTAKRLGLKNMRFFGFDSFQGLPQPDDADETGGRFFEGQFACAREMVEKNLKKKHVDFKRIKLVEGFYEDTLVDKLKDELQAGPAAVVLLDCDIYSSTSAALKWMEGLITDKTVVLFDDWHSLGESKVPDQKQALDEFLRRNGHLVFEPAIEYKDNGKAFIVHLRKTLNEKQNSI